MKIRTGFVSNSSSSSFCIIGVSDNDVVFKLMKADGFPTKQEKKRVDRWDGAGRMKSAERYKKECESAPLVEVLDTDHIGGGYGYWDTKGVKEPKLIYLGGDQPEYAGLNAERLLQNRSIAQAKEYFADYVKNNLNVDIDESEVGLHYGEVNG